MKKVLLLLLAAGAAWGVWIWTHPSAEKVIRRQMVKLEENLSVKAGEGNIARVAAVNRAVSFFTTDVLINGEGMSRVGETIQGRTELQQALFAARSRLEGQIDFSDLHVEVLGETNAVVRFTAVGRLAGQNEPYSQDIKAEVVNVEGSWLISRVDPIAPTLNAAPSQ